MRILVVIAHYFGPRPSDGPTALYGSQFEPLARIEALNESIVALHRSFGSISRTLEQVDLSTVAALQNRKLDIVIVTKKDHNLLPYIGIDASHFAVEYVDDPFAIPFRAPHILRDRLGDYDFYCYLEDDEFIHDREFFDKLVWFQEQFGPSALLMPVRYEMSSSGTPAKVVIDPIAPEKFCAPFRRPGQREELNGIWHGRPEVFRLPSNPHAGGYFLTAEQMRHWVDQPSFADGDASWVGPLESAATLSVGKVFDLYKATEPDPFFLEIQHHGTRFTVSSATPDQSYGDPPLLAIAQGRLGIAAAENAGPPQGDASNAPFDQLVDLWRSQQPVIGYVERDQKRLRVLERQAALAAKKQQWDQEKRLASKAQIEKLRADLQRLKRKLRREQKRRRPLKKALQWLADASRGLAGSGSRISR